MSRGYRFSIDRGGTFTDVYCESPSCEVKVLKVLSEDAAYDNGPREGIRQALEHFEQREIPRGTLLDASNIEWIRMGTTVATNALLERRGERTALVTTRGFGDLLHIGDQSREKIFDLRIQRLKPLFSYVMEVDERVYITRSECEIDKVAPSHETLKTESGDLVHVLKAPDADTVRQQLRELRLHADSVAIVLLHSYAFERHERLIERIAREVGFTHVSRSSNVLKAVRAVPRGHTTCVDAYLTPVIDRYVRHFCDGFIPGSLDNTDIHFMQSDGGLCKVGEFLGCRAILSGPAGGVVGFARRTFIPSMQHLQIVGLDMGGTSTDVSRHHQLVKEDSDEFELRFENKVAGVVVASPQLDVTTVAAGGGSRLFVRENGMLSVGPESAGAMPGPVCYGREGGVLAVTDANAVLGRLLPEYFPKIFGPSHNEALDVEKSRQAMSALLKESQEQGILSDSMTLEQFALGFIKVANESMARPVRAITVAQGHDICEHILAAFGGAGGQHACGIARLLKMKHVCVDRHSGILSALGIGEADVVKEMQLPVDGTWQRAQSQALSLLHDVSQHLLQRGFSHSGVAMRTFANLRFDGTVVHLEFTPTPLPLSFFSTLLGVQDTSLMVPFDATNGDFDDAERRFRERYKRELGFVPTTPILVNDVRVRGVGKVSHMRRCRIAEGNGAVPVDSTRVYFGKWHNQVAVYDLDTMGSGDTAEGPCIVVNGTSTIVVEPACHAKVSPFGDVVITVSAFEADGQQEIESVQLSLYAHRFMSVAEQMGRVLQRTAISTNIKERLDFSCAVFGPDGGLIANAPHLPVHLGAMQEAVRFQIQYLGSDIKEGDVLMSNHPSAGGSHLPDITVMTPVFSSGKPLFWVASRGHHADIGGISPGSMPPFSKHINEEGLAVMSFKLVEQHTLHEDKVVQMLHDAGARQIEVNLSDLRAQVAANQKGISLLQQMMLSSGGKKDAQTLVRQMTLVRKAAEVSVRHMLRGVCTRQKNRLNLPLDDTPMSLHAEDYMDDGTKINLRLTIDPVDGSATFDFSGTGEAVLGNLNAPRAVTYSAVVYALRCMAGDRALYNSDNYDDSDVADRDSGGSDYASDMPLNQGCLDPVDIVIPPHSILNPPADSAVVGGNVLTSQRVTDVVLKAFDACAASQGCMNNLTFGDSTFGVYETIAGGAGAGRGWNGCSGVHTHMTNTRIGDVEIMEQRYPVLVREFSLRKGSGGNGRWTGGDGVVREIVFLRDDISVGILSERRALAPYGLDGGNEGLRGQNFWLKRRGLYENDFTPISLGGKNTFVATAGDAIRVMSPGGGGCGVSMPNSTSS
ncbi:MAG: hypothetical protein MHM6MM_002592 [Cercozoa sp. M6MM]